MSEHVLKVENATMQFGGVVAVDNMNIVVAVHPDLPQVQGSSPQYSPVPGPHSVLFWLRS